MKFCPPLYISDKKIYRSEIKEGFRCEAECENTLLTPSLHQFIESQKGPLVEIIIQQTKGWFSKPLTEKWLQDRIFILFPTLDVSQEFEGTLKWEATELEISKERFEVKMSLVEKVEKQKVVIDFPEEPEEVETKVRHIPKTKEEFKGLVLRERARAGRALFRAERLTQEYCQLYGEDTDWEESEDESGVEN
jgi:hypothetical protein